MEFIRIWRPSWQARTNTNKRMQFVKFVTDFRPMNDDNPYSPPTTAWSTTRDDQSEIELNDLTKIRNLLSEANRFWIVILLCAFLGPILTVLMPIWYGARLSQFGKLAKQYPSLLNQDARPGSLEKKFQSAKWKLIAGVAASVLCSLGWGYYVYWFNFVLRQ